MYKIYDTHLDARLHPVDSPALLSVEKIGTRN